jgi:tetratricopeptide (TPR) repeat protein
LRYRALRALGKGGLGEVFVALDEELNREVALKEIHEKHRGNADHLTRFLLEAEITGRLEHPGVVPVYGLGRYPDGRPYYAMRLIKGETLKDAIDRFHKEDVPGSDPGARGLAFRELLRRFVDVCNAVAYSHSKGVLHRDLKPANVMLGPFGETLVIDWGLAKVLGHATADSSEGVSLLQGTQTTPAGTTGLAGTPGYLSPEQAEGQSNELTPAADVYGLGAILYTLLTGQQPFKGGSVEQQLSRQRRGVFAPPRKIKSAAPPALEAVCLKAMALDPSERYASAKALAADVDHWLGDEPVSAYREPLTARLRRWGRRHRAAVTGLAALLVSLTAALAVGLALVRAEEAKTRAALQDARDQADRAEKAEKGLRIELAHTSASAARVAAQRGQWKDALAHYQTAIDLGHEDDVALWLRVLECRRALYQYRAFREELQRLEERDDLADHRGEVRLMRAMGEMARSGEKVDPTDAIRAALDLGLPPAEDAYARALLAPTMPTAIARLREALRHDPYHRRSLETLTSLLYFAGTRREAREAVTLLEVAAPDSVSAISWRSALLALDGDLDGALRLCVRLRPLIGDEGLALYRDAVLVATQIEASLWDSDQLARRALLAKIETLAPRLDKVMESPDPMNGLGELAVFRLPCYRAFKKLPAVPGEIIRDLLRGKLPDLRQLAAAHTDIVETCPSGLWFYLQGVWLGLSGQQPEACDAFRRALTAPSIMPVARRARFELVRSLTARARKAAVVERGTLEAEARQHLRELARDGVYPAWAYQELCGIAGSVHEDALALALSEAWRQQYPDNVNALRARGRAEDNVGAYRRRIDTLNDLLAQTPNDANLVNHRGIALHHLGAFADATASFFEALRCDPRQPNAADNLTEVESVLRRRLAIYHVLREKLRMRAAMILAHQGQHVEAVQAIATEKAEGDTAVALACLYAIAARAAASDTKLAPQERGKKSEEYAVQSVALLRAVQDAGYFHDPWRVKYLDTERDFDTLKKRDDFVRVMKAIKK